MKPFRNTKVEWQCPECLYFGPFDLVVSHISNVHPGKPGEGALITKHKDQPMTDTQTFEDVFTGIFDEAFDLLVERQRKYGPENIKKLGIYGVFGRLSDDKVERIRRGMNGVVKHGIVQIDDFTDFGDESFEDALFDIANYALIIIALKRGLWGKPLKESEAA